MLKHLVLFAYVIVMFSAVCAGAAETKDIKFPFKNAEPVVFSHEFHLVKYNNNCKVCHNAIFNMKDRRHFTMAEMEKTKSCGACHSGVKAFSVSSEKDCSRCHKGTPRDVTYKINGLSNAVFSHAIHIAKTGGACRSCHNGTVITGKGKPVSMDQMEKGKTCGACHNGKKAFTVAANCDRCHKGAMKPKDIVLKIQGIAPVTFSHNIHTAAYSCKECHTRIFPYKAVVGKATMADMAKGKSCGTCHNGKEVFASTGDCAKCHRGLKPANIVFNLKGITPATFSHEIHTAAYACKDCHTKIFPFKAVVGKATMADMANGKSCGTCHNGKLVFASTGDCAKCHQGMKPGMINFMLPKSTGPVTFSHEFHLQSYKCADCHTKIFPYRAGVSKTSMADMEKGKACGACHNKGKDAFSVADDCDKCHKM
ncbi:MAG: cytochrome c3 family protein [Desulfuromonadales bacterium]|nr:cytochrome c3 family protein [Desulfuromonadales bacterium]